jgi:hypothetical protein
MGTPGTCPACCQPSRQLTRDERDQGITTAFYCRSCSRADDVAAISDYDFVPQRRRSAGAGTPSESMQRALHLKRRIEEGAALHDRALALLNSGELEGEALTVWQGFCDGLTERQIAATIKRSHDYVYRRYLGPLRARCGYSVRKNSGRGAPRHRRGPNKRTAAPQ